MVMPRPEREPTGAFTRERATSMSPDETKGRSMTTVHEPHDKMSDRAVKAMRAISTLCTPVAAFHTDTVPILDMARAADMHPDEFVDALADLEQAGRLVIWDDGYVLLGEVAE